MSPEAIVERRGQQEETTTQGRAYEVWTDQQLQQAKREKELQRATENDFYAEVLCRMRQECRERFQHDSHQRIKIHQRDRLALRIAQPIGVRDGPVNVRILPVQLPSDVVIGGIEGDPVHVLGIQRRRAHHHQGIEKSGQ